MPENTQLKEMKLTYFQQIPTKWASVGENGYTKTITDMHGNLISEEYDLLLLDESQMGAEYFDDWVTQTKELPWFNIVEVQRFR